MQSIHLKPAHFTRSKKLFILQVYCPICAMNLVGISSDLYLVKTTYWICIIYQTAEMRATAWAEKTDKTGMFPTNQD